MMSEVNGHESSLHIPPEPNKSTLESEFDLSSYHYNENDDDYENNFHEPPKLPLWCSHVGDFPVHAAVWVGAANVIRKFAQGASVPSTRRIGSHSHTNFEYVLDSVGPLGFTPLTLCIQLLPRDYELYYPVFEELLQGDADPNKKDGRGWSPVDECISSPRQEIKKLIPTLIAAAQSSGKQRWRRYLSNVGKCLDLLPDFYMEMKWKCTSSIVPFLKYLAPSDTIRIWKVGRKVRIDSSLVSWRPLRACKRKAVSTLVHAQEGLYSKGGGHLIRMKQRMKRRRRQNNPASLRSSFNTTTNSKREDSYNPCSDVVADLDKSGYLMSNSDTSRNGKSNDSAHYNSKFDKIDIYDLDGTGSINNNSNCQSGRTTLNTSNQFNERTAATTIADWNSHGGIVYVDHSLKMVTRIAGSGPLPSVNAAIGAISVASTHTKNWAGEKSTFANLFSEDEAEGVFELIVDERPTQSRLEIGKFSVEPLEGTHGAILPDFKKKKVSIGGEFCLKVQRKGTRLLDADFEEFFGCPHPIVNEGRLEDEDQYERALRFSIASTSKQKLVAHFVSSGDPNLENGEKDYSDVNKSLKNAQLSSKNVKKQMVISSSSSTSSSSNEFYDTAEEDEVGDLLTLDLGQFRSNLSDINTSLRENGLECQMKDNSSLPPSLNHPNKGLYSNLCSAIRVPIKKPMVVSSFEGGGILQIDEDVADERMISNTVERTDKENKTVTPIKFNPKATSSFLKGPNREYRKHMNEISSSVIKNAYSDQKTDTNEKNNHRQFINYTPSSQSNNTHNTAGTSTQSPHLPYKLTIKRPVNNTPTPIVVPANNLAHSSSPLTLVALSRQEENNDENFIVHTSSHLPHLSPPSPPAGKLTPTIKNISWSNYHFESGDLDTTLNTSVAQQIQIGALKDQVTERSISNNSELKSLNLLGNRRQFPHRSVLISSQSPPIITGKQKFESPKATFSPYNSPLIHQPDVELAKTPLHPTFPRDDISPVMHKRGFNSLQSVGFSPNYIRTRLTQNSETYSSPNFNEKSFSPNVQEKVNSNQSPPSISSTSPTSKTSFFFKNVFRCGNSKVNDSSKKITNMQQSKATDGEIPILMSIDATKEKSCNLSCEIEKTSSFSKGNIRVENKMSISNTTHSSNSLIKSDEFDTSPFHFENPSSPFHSLHNKKSPSQQIFSNSTEHKPKIVVDHKQQHLMKGRSEKYKHSSSRKSAQSWARNSSGSEDCPYGEVDVLTQPDILVLRNSQKSYSTISSTSSLSSIPQSPFQSNVGHHYYSPSSMSNNLKNLSPGAKFTDESPMARYKGGKYDWLNQEEDDSNSTVTLDNFKCSNSPPNQQEFSPAVVKPKSELQLETQIKNSPFATPKDNHLLLDNRSNREFLNSSNNMSLNTNIIYSNVNAMDSNEKNQLTEPPRSLYVVQPSGSDAVSKRTNVTISKEVRAEVASTLAAARSGISRADDMTIGAASGTTAVSRMSKRGRKGDVLSSFEKTAKLEVTLAEDFPFSLKDFLPLLEVSGRSRSSVRELIKVLKHPVFAKECMEKGQFPVRIEAPLNVAVSAVLEISDIRILKGIETTHNKKSASFNNKTGKKTTAKVAHENFTQVPHFYLVEDENNQNFFSRFSMSSSNKAALEVSSEAKKKIATGENCSIDEVFYVPTDYKLDYISKRRTVHSDSPQETDVKDNSLGDNHPNNKASNRRKGRFRKFLLSNLII